MCRFYCGAVYVQDEISGFEGLEARILNGRKNPGRCCAGRNSADSSSDRCSYQASIITCTGDGN